ncbi:MAG: hypothetical protein IJ444_01205 [Kiritimatiellae bacterium]|nr:hypothetical protein [Kiritimatiellia bacterium]
MKSNSNHTQIKTPMLNFFMNVKRWFSLRRCIVLGVLVVLFCFFYNPTKIELLFKAIPENSIASIYVNSLSDEWDSAMENNILMGSASVIAKEDLTDLRTNEGLKWTLRLLTGKDSIVSAVDVNGDNDFDFYDNDYLAGATSVGFRRRIMELLWRIKYVPGLGKLGVTEDGIRYLDFSKHKVGPSPRNPVLALDMVKGVLCVAYTSNPSDLNKVTSRVNKNTALASVFKHTDDPWKLRSSKLIPKNFIVWTSLYDGVCGISSLSKDNVELRFLDVSEEISKAFGKMKDFDALNISADSIAARHVAVDDAMSFLVYNNAVVGALNEAFSLKLENASSNDGLASVALLGGAYKFEILGNAIPSLHISSTLWSTQLIDAVGELLADCKKTYTSADNWRNIYLPKTKGFNILAMNTKFGMYAERKGNQFNQGIASINAVKAGTELPKASQTGAYTLGDTFDFFNEECGSSYFIAYCNLKELQKVTNMLQVNLKLAKMLGVNLDKEDIRDFDTAALVVDKLSEADTLSLGISRIDTDKIEHLIKADEVYCLSLNLTRKDK